MKIEPVNMTTQTKDKQSNNEENQNSFRNILEQLIREDVEKWKYDILTNGESR